MRIKRPTLPLVLLAVECVFFQSMIAAVPGIGMASAQHGFKIDNAPVAGNATIFDGSTVSTEGFSRVQINGGTRLDLGAGSKVQLYASRATLQSGTSEVQSTAGYKMQALGLTVEGSKDSMIHVAIDDRHVAVSALSGEASVFSKEGVLVAKVFPNVPMSFLPQAAASNSFKNSGCVLNKAGAAILVDKTGNQVFELRGMDMRKAIGRNTDVEGSIDSSPSPAAAGGASTVVKVSKAVAHGKESCNDLAGKLGATTAVAGLGASAAAGAGAVGVGAAAAGGAAAAAGVATVAGVSTAVVVGGVAAAAAVGGVVAATAGKSTSSP